MAERIDGGGDEQEEEVVVDDDDDDDEGVESAWSPPPALLPFPFDGAALRGPCCCCFLLEGAADRFIEPVSTWVSTGEESLAEAEAAEAAR